MSQVFYQNLNEDNQKFLNTGYDYEVGSVATGDVVLTNMSDWIDQKL